MDERVKAVMVCIDRTKVSEVKDGYSEVETL